MSDLDVPQSIQDRLALEFAKMKARHGAEMQPDRWVYFENKQNNTLYCYNTTPIEFIFGDLEGEFEITRPEKGAWESWVMEPYGKGARTPGKATKWRLRKDSTCRHTLRKDAKARALRLYREEGGR